MPAVGRVGVAAGIDGRQDPGVPNNLEIGHKILLTDIYKRYNVTAFD